MEAKDANFDWIKKEVQLCKKCVGTGKDQHQLNMDETETIDCPWCEGSGRVTKTVTVKYEPYGGENDN